MRSLVTLYVSIATLVSMMTPSTGVPLVGTPLTPDPIDYLRVGLAASGPQHNPPLEYSPYDENGCCVSCGYTYCGTLTCPMCTRMGDPVSTTC